MWIEYFPQEDDRSPAILRRADLPDTVEALCDVCFNSPDDEDIRGLAAHLSCGPYELKCILDVMRSRSSAYSRRKLRIFAQHFKPRDNRRLLGLTPTEIESGYAAWNEYVSELKNLLY